MSTKRIIKIILVASALMLASGFSPQVTNPAHALPLAQTSVTVLYSGSLTGEAGQPVADGAYDFTFALYEAESGGKPLWTEAQEEVMVQEGNFTVLLGSVNPLPKATLEGGARRLEVELRGPGETGFTRLSPRQELSATTLAAPASPSANSSCAHDHWGEYWSGSGVGLHISSSSDSGLWAESAGGWAGVDGRNTTGIGVFGQTTTTDTNGATGVWGEVYSYGDTVRGVLGWARNTSGISVGVWGQSQSSYGTGVKGVANNASCTSGFTGTCSGVFGNSSKGNGLDGYTDTGVAVYGASSGTGVGLKVENQMGMGNLIEAWSGFFPTDLKFKLTSAGNATADGSFTGGGADLAEMLPAVEGLGPGDVLVIGEDGQLTRSSASYQPTVVGVYSTKPGFVGGGGDDADLTGKIPLAVIGVVPVKASAENGAIHPGDLLVASSTPGHAMKAGSDPAVGTVLGKALGSLESGMGVIQMLVMLQ